MEINTKTATTNEIRKMGVLIIAATELGMDVSGYGYADVNLTSGNTFLYLEDYPFTLYIPPCGEDEIYAMWTSGWTGEEETLNINGETLSSLHQWCNELNNAVEV